MAMGAAGIASHKGNGNGHRGRPYGLMLLLAFGITLVGVMAVHKLRERRIFNLLVEEKSHQLISIQQLLQKEKEHTKEMKRKAEETKAKIFSLRNQKMELDHRILEMQSIIDSLKDEQKTMESELEEKQKGNKLLRDRDMEVGNENPQVVALTASLKQKEAEIEDLKQRLESPVRVWSVSTDDPSNSLVNVTVMGSMEQKEQAEFRHKEGGRVHESSAYKGGDNATKVEDGNETTSNFPREKDNNNREGVEDESEKKVETVTRMEMSVEGQLHKQESLGENSRNEGAVGEMKKEFSKHTGISGIDGEKNHSNATERIDNIEQENESRFTGTGQLGELTNPHKVESQKLQQTRRGGKKLETDEISGISRVPGRRRRMLARNRFLKKNVNSETDVVDSISRRFSKEYKDAVSREEGAVSDKEKAQSEEKETSPRKESDHTKANFPKHQNSKNTEDVKHRKLSAEEEKTMSRNQENSLSREVNEHTGVNEEAINHSTQDAKQLEVEAASHIKQNSKEVKELEKKAELNSADKNEMQEDTKVSDKQEAEREATNGDLARDLDV